MRLKAEVNMVHYSVEVPRKFLRLLMSDDNLSDRLYRSLEGIGCDDIDWGGMTGSYIYFAATEEKYRTVSEIRDTVLKTLEVYLSEYL